MLVHVDQSISDHLILHAWKVRRTRTIWQFSIWDTSDRGPMNAIGFEIRMEQDLEQLDFGIGGIGDARVRNVYDEFFETLVPMRQRKFVVKIGLVQELPQAV